MISSHMSIVLLNRSCILLRKTDPIKFTIGQLNLRSRAYQSRPISRPKLDGIEYRITKSTLASCSLVVGFCISTVGCVLVWDALQSDRFRRTTDSPPWKPRPLDSVESGASLHSFAPLTNNTSDNMATAEAPGRPENLTPEQEEKLREFWSVLLGVFGLIAKSELNNTDGGQDHAASNADVEYSSIDTSTKTGTTDTDVVKKRHRGLFSRKASKGLSDESVDDSSNGDGSGHHKINTRGAEDKYGQTRDFKAALSSQSPEELRAAFWTMLKHDHPDALLLRFLRARKWDIEKALVMLISTMHWRANEMHVDDDIMRIGESGALNSSLAATGTAKVEGEEFLNQLRLGKSFLHGVDKTGRPVCIVRVRLHKQGDQSEKTVERYTVYVIETARLLLRGPIDTAAIIFDMTGFSLANMDYQPVKFMIKCFEANYPESLGVVLVHKAPWVFQGIWNIIKGWLDPVVASKINFTKSVEDLEQFIPRSQILKELGGEEDWTYNFIEPGTKEDIQMSDSSTQSAIQAERDAMVTKFEKMTIAWINARDSKPSNDVKLERDIIAKALAENYWKIDPYTRARSLYDRIGVIKSGGLLDFYPNGTSPQSRTNDELD